MFLHFGKIGNRKPRYVVTQTATYRGLLVIQMIEIFMQREKWELLISWYGLSKL